MTTLKAANRIEQEAERRSRKCRPIVTCMEQVPVLTVHASRKRTPPIQRQLGGGGSGMLVKAECQQEAEAARQEVTPIVTWMIVLPLTGPSDHSSAVPSDYMDDCYSGFIGLRPARMRKH